MMKNLSAVILAGRENRHLKMLKSTLPFGDSTVLNRTLQAYLDAGISELVLVLGHRAAEIRESLGNLEGKVKIVMASEPEGDTGLLLREGVAAVSSSSKAFALGAGDQPLLAPELLNELSAVFEAGKTKILAPVVQGAIGQPVFFDISLVKDFQKLGDHNDAWEVLKANSEEVFDLHRYETTLIRGIDDLEDFFAMLDLAKLPHPELIHESGEPARPEPVGAMASGGSSGGGSSSGAAGGASPFDDAAGSTYHSDDHGE